MEPVPNVDKVFFPLDEELELLPGTLAPRQQEHLVHLACFMPFEKAAQMLEVILWVQTNQETARGLTEHMGACMEASQTAQADTFGLPEVKEEPTPHRCVISADEAMVPLVKKQWAEVRTLAIGEPQEKRIPTGELEIHVGKPSYFSRLTDASSFLDLAEVEIRRCKMKEAKEVCAVMDRQIGVNPSPKDIDQMPCGSWIFRMQQNISVSCWKPSFGHARMLFPPQVLSRCLHILKHRGPRPLLGSGEKENDMGGYLQALVIGS